MVGLVPEIQCWLQVGAGPGGIEEGDPFGGVAVCWVWDEEGGLRLGGQVSGRRWRSEGPDWGTKRRWASVLGSRVTCL